MKLNNFRGGLTDVSAKKEALMKTETTYNQQKHKLIDKGVIGR